MLPCLESARTTIVYVVSQYLQRRPLARLLSTFLCCLAIVIRPVSRLGGSYAFLVLPFQALVFGVQESLAQQLELTALNIAGALCGIGFSTLGKYIASLVGEESPRARVTCAVFLVVISFFAGLVKSRLVRLTLSMRISLFASIWLLTLDIGVKSKVLEDSGHFLYAAITPACLSLVSLLIVMSLLRWSSSSFEKEMAATFALLQKRLSVSLEHIGKDLAVEPEEYVKLRKELFQRSVRLNETYSQAAFELRVGRLSLKSIRPLIGTVEHLRRELAWGMSTFQKSKPGPKSGPMTHASSRLSSPIVSRRNSLLQSPATPFQATQASHERIIAAIEVPALSLGHAIVGAMRAVELVIIVAFDQDTSTYSAPAGRPTSTSVKFSLRMAEKELVRARDKAREKLGHVFDEMDMEAHEQGKNVRYPKRVLDGSLVMIALLQMAQEMRTALQVADRMYVQYEESRVRLWYPRISLAWLGVAQRNYISDSGDAAVQIQAAAPKTGWETPNDGEANLTLAETAEGLIERGYSLGSPVLGNSRLPGGLSFSILGAKERAGKGRKRWAFLSLPDFVAWLWSQSWVLRLRLRLARGYRSVTHSQHLRHATKNAIGVAVLSLPAFLPSNNSARVWFSSWHGEWMVISYVWVLETSTGATWRVGYLRLVGTATSALYAYIVWLICRTNPYGLTIMVTAAEIPFTWLSTKTNLGPLAVPAAVTLPIIAFAEYVTHTQQSIIALAGIRALMIAIGIVAALLMNGLVFPRHCRVLFLSDTARTLGLLSQLYMTLSHYMFRAQPALAYDDKRKTLKMELQIRYNVYLLNALITTMHDEISLVPKPLAHYRRTVAIVQRLLDGMTGLRKIRENIPRKETVSNVFNERRDFMSCVCITLYACQHAFRAREPLPQFLPSPKHALENLEAHVQDSIRRAREEDPHAMGLSLIYAFAEMEVMKHMVCSLEELLELTGRLFGTTAWLTHSQHVSVASLHEEVGDHGWYSTFKWEEA
ncbi:hypothetical protein DAEQUDRAFT_729793 [Daedalea quercina L-15889]|uniref:Uncharacterized protein n=1 Tax=Daedalea quercina L-15889 TaxID=1314783 RepID=A0A165ND57_9APHY|nr:hypothetical protein DAEQUDRAFT_729793 [Daedalea quercina L-15889]